MSASHDPFPPHFFARADESADAGFYREPRFVTHVDRATIEALTQVYREVIAPGARVLDLIPRGSRTCLTRSSTSGWPASG